MPTCTPTRDRTCPDFNFGPVATYARRICPVSNVSQHSGWPKKTTPYVSGLPLAFDRPHEGRKIPHRGSRPRHKVPPGQTSRFDCPQRDMPETLRPPGQCDTPIPQTLKSRARSGALPLSRSRNLVFSGGQAPMRGARPHPGSADPIQSSGRRCVPILAFSYRR